MTIPEIRQKLYWNGLKIMAAQATNADPRELAEFEAERAILLALKERLEVN